MSWETFDQIVLCCSRLVPFACTVFIRAQCSCSGCVFLFDSDPTLSNPFLLCTKPIYAPSLLSYTTSIPCYLFSFLVLFLLLLSIASATVFLFSGNIHCTGSFPVVWFPTVCHKQPSVLFFGSLLCYLTELSKTHCR